MAATESDLIAEIATALFSQNGPLLGGNTLSQTLGYTSSTAFRQARRRGTLGVRTFKIPGRRGVYALTDEVARWIAAQAQGSFGVTDREVATLPRKQVKSDDEA